MLLQVRCKNNSFNRVISTQVKSTENCFYYSVNLLLCSVIINLIFNLFLVLLNSVQLRTTPRTVNKYAIQKNIKNYL